jgi:hypothetical protein
MAYFGALKTSTRGFPKKEIEEIMADWPSGKHIVLEGRSPEGVDLIAVGYRYNCKKVLSFVGTKDAGDTAVNPARPYYAKFPDEYNNVASRAIDRPFIISEYFTSSNCIDAHNHIRQGVLKLEKHWVTQQCWYRIFTTMLGINLTDAWKAHHHGLGDEKRHKNMKVKKFADLVALQIFEYPWCMEVNKPRDLAPLDVVMDVTGGPPSLVSTSTSADCSVVSEVTTGTPLSNASINTNITTTVSVPPFAPKIPERFRREHQQKKNNYIAATKRFHRRECSVKECHSQSSVVCVPCGNKPFCMDKVSDSLKATTKCCFYAHICEHFVNSDEIMDDDPFIAAYKSWNKKRTTKVYT